MLKETYKDADTEIPEDTVSYAYDSSGSLASMTDSATGNTTTYYYDLTDRLMKYVVSDGTSYHSVEYTYDALNNMTGLKETVDGHTTTTTYTYDKDNRITGMSDGTTSVSYTYDAFGRLEKKETKNGSAVVKTETFAYQLLREDDIYTSSQIKEHKVTVGGTTTTYSYTYDQKGNIRTISDGSSTVTYTYDSQSQLLSEKNETAGLDQSWEYNASGNITKRTEGSETIDYTYKESGWKDLLEDYNGMTIVYDDVGNPTTYGEWSMEWVHGRQLASMKKADGEKWTYTYGADGLRTSRSHTHNGTTTTWEYVYNGSQLTQMKKGSDTLHFTYDATGTPTTVTHKTATGETTYYYVTNLQGDVVKIIDSTGTTVATYTYDAWGNPISTANTTPSTLESLNPLRYRGYVYDAETGFYYLQSRYYNPQIGRFLNADSFASTGQGFVGHNMFAYCGNNPVTHDDDGGNYWETAIDIISLCISIVDVACNPDDPMAWVGVAADIVFLAAPVVAGGGAIVKAATKADDVVDVVKAADNLGEVGEVVVKYGDEVKLPNQIKVNDAVDAWDDFLGPNQTSYNKFSGNNEMDRIFSADGTRSIRFGSHEMRSIGTTKAHFHYENWQFDPESHIVYVMNTLQRLK